MLRHDKRRTILAAIGIFLAITLVFFELGLFFAVPKGGLLLYDHLRFDLMLASNQYQYQVDPGQIPPARLAQVAAMPEVAAVMPLYFGAAKWEGGTDDRWPDIFLIGFSTRASPFKVAGIEDRLKLLRRPDTILVDDKTLPMFGPLTPGRLVKLNGRPEVIGASYQLGTGFMGLGVALLGARNFARLFPLRGLRAVNLAPIRLKPGVAPKSAARALRKALPHDVQIFTRKELYRHEVRYWTTRTAVGLIFGSGLVIAIVVGIMIIYQAIATQVGRNLPQFATLKAIGYDDRRLCGTVAAMALILIGIVFIPSCLVSLWFYGVIRHLTLLPAEMTGWRIAEVLGASLAMAVVSGFLSLASLSRAAPAEIFGQAR